MKENIGNDSQLHGLNGSRKSKNLLINHDDDEVKSNPEMKIMTNNVSIK